MDRRLKIIEFVGICLICPFIFWYVGFNTYLNFASKEHFISIFVLLSLLYVNYKFLYQKLYARQRIWLYCLLSASSVLLSGFLEISFVDKNVTNYVPEYLKNASPELQRFLLTVYVVIQHFGFLLYTFFINQLKTSMRELRQQQDYIRQTSNIIYARDTNYQLIQIPVPQILFCKQERSVCNIYTIDGQCYRRNCSMSDLKTLIGDKLCLRISRNMLAIYQYILSYTENSICISASSKEKELSLPLSNTYKEEALQNLQKYFEFKETQNNSSLSFITPNQYVAEGSRIEPETSNIDSKTTITSIQNKEQPPKRLSISKRLEEVYTFIKNHKYCKTNDIAVALKVSSSSVSRYIQELVNLGKVEYWGAKKNGGYIVTNGRKKKPVREKKS